MRHEVMAAPPASAWARLLHRHFFVLVTLAWAASAALMVAMAWTAIATRHFPDADDQIRLLEVHDWIDGQAFRDVTQYRMNPPAGAPMHWSRLVDMPIAAVILALRPFLGYEAAQTAAAVAIPMLLLLATMLLVGWIARRLAGAAAGLLAAVASITSFGVVIQYLPLRVDHHNWQILLSLAAVAAGLARPGRRSGLIAGAVIAVALQISLETLPFAALCGAVLAFSWALSPTVGLRDRMCAFAAALFGVEAVLTAILRADVTGYCDAASMPHIVALGVAAAGLAIVACFAPSTVRVRIAALGLVAGAALAAFRALPPHCGLDAFPMLEPIVRRHWYENVMEGMPVWRQSTIMAAAAIGFPIVSLVCAGFALHGTRGADRVRWATLTALLACATAVAVLVERAGCLASLIAVPPAAWATVRLVPRIQSSERALVRMLGTVLVILALSPMAPSLVAAAIPSLEGDDRQSTEGDRDCGGAGALRALDALPPGVMFAPMNVGPTILLQTRHSIVTSGYHRNHAAIGDELAAYLGSDGTARRILDRHRVRYVEFCADGSETAYYRQVAPNGFAAHLSANRAPAWLRPLNGPSQAIRVWEMRP